MFLKMSDEKQSTTEPTVVFATSSEVSGEKLKSRLTKKHVLIAVISLLITGLVVAAVLVSIRMFTDSHMEELKYSLQANGVSQNVSTSENSVIFHVTKNNVEAWIIQNFDTGLEVSKVIADGKTVCYVTSLNRSRAVDPSAIPSTTPDVNSDTTPSNQVYKVLPDRIPDISFLGKKASTACQNIPTYHAVPDCGSNIANGGSFQNSTSDVDHRTKRTPALCAYYLYAGYYWPCVCGCCSMICGRFTSNSYVCTYTGGRWICTYWMNLVVARGYMSYPSCTYGGLYYWP